MKNDFLRVNNYDGKDKDVVVSVYEKKTVVKEKKKKYSLLAILGDEREANKICEEELTAAPIPRPNMVFSIILMLLISLIVMYFAALITSSVPVLLLMGFVASFIIPIFAVLFFYEMNTRKNISLIEIIGGFIIGVAIYLFLNALDKFLAGEFAKYDTVFSFVGVALRGLILFFASMIYAKALKKHSVFGIILLVVCIYSGYSAIKSFSSLASSMMIGVQVTSGSQLPYAAGAIINDSSYFQKSMENFISSISYNALFIPFLTVCWAVINGAVIGLNTLSEKTDKYPTSSFYLLTILTIVLNMFVNFPTTIKIFSIILNILSFAVSAVIAVRITNYCLSKENFTEENGITKGEKK